MVFKPHSDFKYNLRKCEQAFQTREAVRVIKGLSALGRKDWLRYLFAHFHDAIPGSSINSVYKDLNPELRNIWVNQFEKAKLEIEVNKSETCSVSFNVELLYASWKRVLTFSINSL